LREWLAAGQLFDHVGHVVWRTSMAAPGLYHQGNRTLQDEFGSRALADRLEELARTAFTPEDTAYIEDSIYFFLATADADGRPDCSFKGGPPGFVRVTGPTELAFPDYDGNGMFKSLGNLEVNPHVGLLFISMHGKARRLRVSGDARVLRDDPLLAEMPGAQMIVRVRAQAIFPNCPRYIPHLELEARSPYEPAAGRPLVEPAWKSYDAFRDVAPPRKPTRR
jgi:predicted pyridoxine 5'-phosphate oxidase superfamily flavin-nucleotide-binding protein